MPVHPDHLRQLCELFAMIETRKEAQMLLEDILTPQELESVVERWQLVQGLASGEAQRDLAERLGISISKITRGSRTLQYGAGGFRHFLKKFSKKK